MVEGAETVRAKEYKVRIIARSLSMQVIHTPVTVDWDLTVIESLLRPDG